MVFEAVKLFAAAYMTGVWQLLLGTTLILVILVAPMGIVGLMNLKQADHNAKEKKWNHWFARKA